MILGLVVLAVPMFSHAGSQTCDMADGGELEASVQIGATYDISEEERQEVLEQVIGRLEDRLPFLVLVARDDQPHLRIELSTDKTLLVDRDVDPPEGEGYPVVGEDRWAEVSFTKITCQNEPHAYKNCADRVKVAQRLSTEKAEIATDDPSALVDFFVDAVTQKICKLYGTTLD